jgi:dienelactone hydrolase
MKRNRTVALVFVLALGAGLAGAIAPTGAQSLPSPGFADYGKWETLGVAGGGGGRGGGGGGGGLSNDGKWLAYAINRSNRENELRLLNLATNTLTTEKFGAALAFTDDSKWAAWSVGYSEAEQERMRTQQRPIQNKVAIMNLGTGDKSTVDAIQSFAFSPDGRFLLMRRYAPTPAGGAGAAAAPGPGRAGGGRGGAAGAPAPDDPDPAAISVTVRTLATGADMTFSNVGETAWKDSGSLLAMTISAAERAGNGVHLYDASTGILRVLDSTAAQYLGLAWRRASADLLVMRGKTDEKREGSTYLTLTWSGVGTPNEKALTYDPTADARFPSGMRVVSFRRAAWSEDGKKVLLGIAKWDERAATAGRGRTGGEGAAAPEAAGGAGGTETGRGARGAGAAADPPENEMADVTVWHWKDAQVASVQKLTATADRRRNLLGVWHMDTGGFTQIGRDFQETIQLIPKTNLALVQEWGKYAMQRSIGRTATDLTLANLATGGRTPLKTNLGGGAQISPGGKYLLFVENDAWWTLNLQTKAVANLSKAAATSFIDKESDATTKQKPSFGAAGWTKDDGAVLLNDKYDIWSVAPDGSKATRLTNGAAERVRHLYVRVDFTNPTDAAIDLSKPMYLSLFGDWSKKSGYGVLKPGAATVERLLFADKSIDRLARARDAEVYLHGEQTYADSPDLFVSQGGLTAGKQVTNTNPFQRDYAWGRSEIVEYAAEKTAGGRKMQGALYYPAGYVAGKQYPMIVYMYETLSDGVHRYVTPSSTSYYNTSVFTTQGYFVFQPDIVFRPREPGISVVECVRPAVAAVVAKGVVDPKRVGIIGHSWGGFDTAFLATNTQGVFSAAVAGAAITNLISNFGNGHWSSGILETDHIETGQQRMEVPLYEDLNAYLRNSAVFNIQNMTVPTLVEVGNVDGTVHWYQGLEFYSIARRAGKNVVMIEYANEDHGLAQRRNQQDYQQRILQWFGHYLKGEPAKEWITNGQTVIDRQDEVRKAGRGGRGGN